MEIQGTFHFNTAPKDILALFCDQAHLQKRYESAKCKNIVFHECAQDGDVFRIKTTRDLPSKIPGFAKKVLGNSSTIDQVDEWIINDDESIQGTFECDLKGAPIRVDGHLHLKPADGGTEYVITANIHVKIPLIGNKMANIVAKDTRDAWDHDVNLAKECLAG